MGYELVGIEYRAHGRNGVLSVYIDARSGVTLEDCERVSYQVSGLLDVEDPISGRYTLEVSSPGLDRPLFSKEHFVRFAGRRVRIQLHTPLEGRRKFTGILHGMRGEQEVVIEQDGTELCLPLEWIKLARLVPEL